MKIYVASSWRNMRQPVVVDTLRSNGHEVYDFKNPPDRAGFGWEQLNPDYQTGQKMYWADIEKMLAHEIAGQGFDSDFRALQTCDACVLVLPCNRSAHLELGYAVGQGKVTAVLYTGEDEPELMYKMVHLRTASMIDLVEYLS